MADNKIASEDIVRVTLDLDVVTRGNLASLFEVLEVDNYEDAMFELAAIGLTVIQTTLNDDPAAKAVVIKTRRAICTLPIPGEPGPTVII